MYVSLRPSFRWAQQPLWFLCIRRHCRNVSLWPCLRLDPCKIAIQSTCRQRNCQSRERRRLWLAVVPRTALDDQRNIEANRGTTDIYDNAGPNTRQ